MEYIWAPWRMAYILSHDRPEGCLFCDKAAENQDQENAILHRSTWTFVMLNAYPYNPGHLMVIPYRHLAGLTELSDEESHDLADVTRRCVRILDRALGPDGLNIGVNQGEAAGAGVADHVHQHVVPRWSGDTNFMTTVGHTKVLPELVVETYAKLLPFFSRANV